MAAQSMAWKVVLPAALQDSSTEHAPSYRLRHKVQNCKIQQIVQGSSIIFLFEYFLNLHPECF